jgi:hypothetical protein
MTAHLAGSVALLKISTIPMKEGLDSRFDHVDHPNERGRGRKITSEPVIVGCDAQPKIRLGTGIVNALAKQLDVKVDTLSDPHGTSVSVTHATFAAKKARAA